MTLYETIPMIILEYIWVLKILHYIAEKEPKIVSLLQRCKESENCIYQSPVLVKIVKSSKVLRIISTNTEPYSEPSQSFTMKNFVKTV